MEIINAFWEKRNLDIDAFEVKLSKDDFSDVDNVIKQIDKVCGMDSYITVKIPVSNLKALHFFEKNGFNFMENQLHMCKILSNYETPKSICKMKNFLVQEEVEKNKDSWLSIVNLITDNMFYTDRIYLDPLLPEGSSCKRYKNWIMDLLEDPEAHLFVYKYKDTPIGFGLVKMDNNTGVINDLLEGIFEKYQDSGFGYMMFDLALRSYCSCGMKKLITSISSNNPSIVDLDLLFGYTIVSGEYVLRRFNKGEM